MTGIANGESGASVRGKLNSVLVTEFESMAAMLADTSMTYTAGQGPSRFESGRGHHVV